MISNKLKSTRKDKRLTQRQAAEKFDVSERTYRAWESDNPNGQLKKAFKLFKWIGLIKDD